MKFVISPYSDDIISYKVDGVGDGIDAASAKFSIMLPNGTEIPVNVNYTDCGWDISLNLPKGSSVKVNNEPARPFNCDDCIRGADIHSKECGECKRLGGPVEHFQEGSRTG